ncbi:MAG TPA: hypothetical protein VE010_14665 [Thermoanaerobaculia bacterium]|nr:hypothetical protein [Thermoanaerobaculia bacterium]
MKVLPIALTLILCALPAIATPPRAPVEVSIAAGATVSRDASPRVTLTLTVAAEAPMEVRLTVFVRSVTGTPVTDGQAFAETFTVERTVTRTVNIPVRGAGDFRVNAIVQGTAPTPSDKASVFVRLSEDGHLQLYTPEEFIPILARDRAATTAGFGAQPAQRATTGKLFDAVAQPSVFVGGGKITTAPGRAQRTGATADAAATSNPLTLSGNVNTVFNATNVLMGNVEVQVWDHDTVSPDDYLGTAMTDAAGNYNITVENDDGPLGGGVDVYLYIYSRYLNTSMIYLVSDGEGGYVSFNYAWRSPTVDDITQRTYTINYQLTDNAEEAAAWMGASSATALVKASTGRTLSYIEIRNPGLSSGTWFNASAGYINIDQQLADAPIVVGHEVGHAVQYQAYGTSVSEGGFHTFCPQSPVSLGLAWSEGFATAFGMVAVNSDGLMHWHVGDAGYSIEKYWCASTAIANDEGRIAAALWDLWDAANDSNGGDVNFGATGFSDSNQGAQLVGADALLTPLWTSIQNDVTAYWGVLKPRLNATQTAPSVNIMSYNYYPAP